MATVSHTIYSRYDPQERERLERETGQSSDLVGSDDTWQQEANLASRRRHHPPPHFIPASLPSTEWDSARASSSHIPNHGGVSVGNELSSWYRSLSSSRESGDSTAQSVRSAVPSIIRNNSSPSLRRTSEKKNKNNWFIMKAIQSEPSSSRPSTTPSLADILARDPPPLPTEEKYKPPVWLELGPSNKGFTMLQRSGWNEGEALGPDVIRRPRPPASPRLDRKGKRQEDNVTHQVLELKSEEYDDVSELREVAIIDLTLSDSDSEIDDLNPNAGKSVFEEHPPEKLPSSHMSSSAHGGTALLTPLATVLKSDRLGIGLKAKTVGPYKASKKRVTHNAAAMTAHIRTAEANRRQRKEYGRGRRGYDKLRKREEAERKRLLAYIKN
jgi:hypothetical protein